MPLGIIQTQKLLLMSQKDKLPWMNSQDFFILASYFQSYLSDLRGKLFSYKIAQIFSVLLMYFSLKNFRNILGRAVPYVISAVYCYICQISIYE